MQRKKARYQTGRNRLLPEKMTGKKEIKMKAGMWKETTGVTLSSTAPVQATLVPDAVFEESLLLTSSTLGNMATRIPQWLESLGARNGECKRKI